MAVGLIGALLTAPLKSKAETVTVVSNSNSGIQNAGYTATLSDGTVLGFCDLGSNTSFCGAISQRTSLNVPDSVIVYSSSSTNRYPVKRIGYNSKLDLDNAQSVTSLTLSPIVTSLYSMAPTVKTLHLNSYFTDLNSNCLLYINKVLVPATTLSSFLGNQNWYNYVLINEEGTNPLAITINMTKPGEFAQLLLEKIDDWKKVNELTVTGELTTDDLNVFKRMKQLTVLDLSGATIVDIPDNFDENSYGFGVLETLKLPNLNSIGKYAFWCCPKLNSVSMPKVNTIGQDAFRNCGRLQSITFPDGISSIIDGAFRNTGLKSVSIPNTITKISNYCFAECAQLVSVTIPNSVKEIESYAFYNTALTSVSLPGVKKVLSWAFSDCKQLNKVTFSEGLYLLQGGSFAGCSALTEIDLPSSLRELQTYSAFKNCRGIKKVICRAVTPPASEEALLFGCDMTDVKLYVPAMSIDNYRTQNGWKSFYTILPMAEKLTDVLIYDNEVISDASQFASGCNFTLDYFQQYRNGSTQTIHGALDYNATSTLSMGDYKQIHDLGTAASDGPYAGNSHHTSLIANGPMKANNVKTVLYTKSNDYWYFICLPYDVKVSDINYTDGTQFVIRRYSGLNRSNSSTSTWQNLTADSIMHAYEGYILKCNRNDFTVFEFPAFNNTKNNIFAKDDVVMPLKEYPSEFAHNRSWNLVGNPYPCYYDTRFMDFSAPFTLWNRYNSRYDAFSPVDDSYILKPAQAFFVQRPLDQANITFDKEGRQNDGQVRTINMAGRRVAANRQLYNVYLSNGENEDHTRFVFNEGATRSYELDKDASKLIADGNASVLLYTVEDEVKYAINERDYADGQVHLGFYAPQDGEYCLSLETNATENATLIDHETKTQTSMIGNYTFMAKAGYNDARFTLEFGASGIRELNNDNVMINVHDGVVSSNVRCRVYTIDGRMVGTCDADNPIDLDKGVYVICGNNVTRKIIVK